MGQDEALFKRLRSGDSSALDALIRMYYPDIFRYCMWHTDSRQAAEDATQEIFCKAVQHLDGYTHHGKFKAYLYKIAVTTCADLWRCTEPVSLPVSEAYIEPGFEGIESDIAFTQMISLLPAAQREVIILRYVHGLKLREIADILQEPLRTIQSRLRTALKTLEHKLKEGAF